MCDMRLMVSDRWVIDCVCSVVMAVDTSDGGGWRGGVVVR